MFGPQAPPYFLGWLSSVLGTIICKAKSKLAKTGSSMGLIKLRRSLCVGVSPISRSF